MSETIYSVTPLDPRQSVNTKAIADAKALGMYPCEWDLKPHAQAHADRLSELTGVKWSVCWSEPITWWA